MNRYSGLAKPAVCAAVIEGLPKDQSWRCPRAGSGSVGGWCQNSARNARQVQRLVQDLGTQFSRVQWHLWCAWIALLLRSATKSSQRAPGCYHASRAWASLKQGVRPWPSGV